MCISGLTSNWTQSKVFLFLWDSLFRSDANFFAVSFLKKIVLPSPCISPFEMSCLHFTSFFSVSPMQPLKKTKIRWCKMLLMLPEHSCKPAHHISTILSVILCCRFLNSLNFKDITLPMILDCFINPNLPFRTVPYIVISCDSAWCE
jgi:hypothetical protein